MSEVGEKFYSVIERDGKTLLGSAVVGSIAFPLLLGTFQNASKRLGVSCASRFCSLFGFASVSLAGYGASWAALRVLHFMRNDSSFPGWDWFIAPELVLSTIGSVVVFRALGGKFKNVLPSHLLFPGAFAGSYIPANLNPATTAARRAVQQLGRRYGCHSCGRKKVADFVADHQPPSAILRHAKNGDVKEVKFLQQFYPHCPNCSINQSNACKRYLQGVRNDLKALVTHSRRLRVYHTFLPLPAALVFGKEVFSRHSTVDKEVGTTTKSPSDVSTADGPGKTASNSTSASPTSISTPSSTTTKSAPSSPLPSAGTKSSNQQDKTSYKKDVHAAQPEAGGFPLLIVWQHLVKFMDSLPSPLAAFHLTLWTFSIIAAWGTI